MAIGCKFDFAQDDELAQADLVIDDLIELKTMFMKMENGYLPTI